jgi:tRNA uridine 5-carboxymethylaminomethyl modification enzyme
MGVNIDKSFLQSRMINTAKGPAVHSLRAQADKARYHDEMKRVIEAQPHLCLKQAEAVELLLEEGRVCGLVTRTGAIYRARAVILATGTFLRGRIFIGDSAYDSGPNGLAPSVALADDLKAKGMRLRRFKTGTPARALGSSLDYSRMEEQKGDDPIVPFSFLNDSLEKEQHSCWLTYTNEETHRIIRENIDRSPLYGGMIEGTGPRYCPSIEDKVMRFQDKDRHQVFVEPEGLYTSEMYIDGMSSSMPEDVQFRMYRTVPGLENARIVRNAYAIEYDCIDAAQLRLTLEFKAIRGLYAAGQFNGSSGYEEAAAQGLIAGINAVKRIRGEEELVLDRSQAYIGVLIDDLVTKDNREPYRMMTARAEYRLILRQDNADERLTPIGYRIGLVSEERWNRFNEYISQVEAEVARLEKTHTTGGASLADLIRRPELSYEAIADMDPDRPSLSRRVREEAEIRIKYEGYVERQERQVAQFKKMENRRLPEDLDYETVPNLRIEARQKLQKVKPASIGQASRIGGVSPADLSVLLLWLRKNGL